MSGEAIAEIVIHAVLSAVLLFVGFAIGLNKGYIAGQTDALSGTIKYELKEQPNGELKWERITK